MKDKTITIMGGAGMLGLALMRQFGENNDIIIIDSLSRVSETRARQNHRTSYLGQQDRVTSVFTDIDYHDTAINELVALCEGSDIIINCAADVGGIRYNQSNGQHIFARNAMLQSIPLLVAERAGVEKFIQVSSVCVYSPSTNFHAEDSYLGSLSVDNGGYALAKRAGEQLAMASSIGDVIIVRPTNMFGTFDHFDDKAHVIPALIAKFQLANETGEQVTITDPDVERDFLHVDQAAEWIEMLLDLPARRTRMNTYNLPASKNGRKRIVDVAYLLKEQYPSAKFTLQYDSISHERMRHVDGRKLKEALGGDHFIGDFVQDLRNTCAYLDHYADENMFRRAYHAAF